MLLRLSLTGSHLEGSYALKSFGIPAEHLPVDKITGQYLDNTWLNENYLVERKRLEDEQLARRQNYDEEVIVPTGKDCLLGRGRPFQEHVGNVRLAAMIDQHRAEFSEAGTTYGQKTKVCDTIVNLIHESGGRFLRHKTSDPLDGWEVVDSDIARDKVSHGFRVKRMKRNTSASSNKS